MRACLHLARPPTSLFPSSASVVVARSSLDHRLQALTPPALVKYWKVSFGCIYRQIADYVSACGNFGWRVSVKLGAGAPLLLGLWRRCSWLSGVVAGRGFRETLHPGLSGTE